MLDDLASFQRVLLTNPRVRALSDAIASGAVTLPDSDLPLDALEQRGKVVSSAPARSATAGRRSPTRRYRSSGITTSPLSVPGRSTRSSASCSRRARRSSRATYELARSRWEHEGPPHDVRSRPRAADRFVGNPAPRDDWNKFDMPTLRGISRTAPYFHNNSAATLKDIVDHYIDFFKRVEVNFQPGSPIPPIATTDGVHFDRRPTLEERAALLAYLRKQ